MLTLSGMIVANVGTDYINTYLKRPAMKSQP